MTLAERLRADETLFTAWSAIPDPLVAEFLARTAFDAVTLDMQHGCHSTESVMRGVAAVTLAGKPAIVRIPVGRFEMASRALDFGATAVIAPMVNSLADARAFAGSMKYPPLGERSWGPTRVLALKGIPDSQAYLASANRETLAIAMIETQAALAALDDIIGGRGDRRHLRRPVGFFHRHVGRRPRRRHQRRRCWRPPDRSPRKRARPENSPASSRSAAQATPRYREMGFRLCRAQHGFRLSARAPAVGGQ